MRYLAVVLTILGASAAHAGDSLAIYFVDVEIGNAVLLVTPSGQSLLMDAGSHLPNNRDRDRVMAALKKAGVARLDTVPATHYHSDHYGAIADLAPLVPIVNFVDHGAFVQYAKGREWYSGVEDIRQTNYHPQGGQDNNAPGQFIANIPPRDAFSPAYSIHVSVARDGRYTVTNERNQFSKTYEARK